MGWKYGTTFIRVIPCEYHEGRVRVYKHITLLREDVKKWANEIYMLKGRFHGNRMFGISGEFFIYQYEKPDFFTCGEEPKILFHIPTARFYSYKKYLKANIWKYPMKKIETQATFFARQLRAIGVIDYERKG